ncbi:hypothetical protein IDH44_09190 [Paenibacillus sp. IB182496]|uniref:Uncharacterized protein n=1 Tax=Paenibacillus sabuli TaxID=2772509 RepID=A0A927BTR3_9BACL|nr:hypothetical protein [Paenibacillus sabuli]MBD2845364.1 hypothetical protein [Paenibacillus sabuli]
MAEEINISDRQRKFMCKWAAVRSKGKLRYILSRGLILGALLFGIWLIVNYYFEDKARYALYPGQWNSSHVIWLVTYVVIGFSSSFWRWKGKEDKFYYYS